MTNPGCQTLAWRVREVPCGQSQRGTRRSQIVKPLRRSTLSAELVRILRVTARRRGYLLGRREYAEAFCRIGLPDSFVSRSYRTYDCAKRIAPHVEGVEALPTRARIAAPIGPAKDGHAASTRDNSSSVSPAGLVKARSPARAESLG